MEADKSSLKFSQNNMCTHTFIQAQVRIWITCTDLNSFKRLFIVMNFMMSRFSLKQRFFAHSMFFFVPAGHEVWNSYGNWMEIWLTNEFLKCFLCWTLFSEQPAVLREWVHCLSLCSVDSLLNVQKYRWWIYAYAVQVEKILPESSWLRRKNACGSLIKPLYKATSTNPFSIIHFFLVILILAKSIKYTTEILEK